MPIRLRDDSPVIGGGKRGIPNQQPPAIYPRNGNN